LEGVEGVQGKKEGKLGDREMKSITLMSVPAPAGRFGPKLRRGRRLTGQYERKNTRRGGEKEEVDLLILSVDNNFTTGALCSDRPIRV